MRRGGGGGNRWKGGIYLPEASDVTFDVAWYTTIFLGWFLLKVFSCLWGRKGGMGGLKKETGASIFVKLKKKKKN